MGMDAEVLAIGPWGAFRGDDLDYDVNFYRDSIQAGDEEIIVQVARADTTSQSNWLADVCCTEPWALGRHKVERIDLPDHLWPDDKIGGEYIGQLVAKFQRLLDAGCDLWYRPNG